MSLIQTDIRRVVVGLGVTGLSTLRFLSSRGIPCVAVDTQMQAERLQQIQREFPQFSVLSGEAAIDAIDTANEIYLSPGIAMDDALLEVARREGASISGDLDLFVDAVEAPVLAITGTNGKSTVTALLGELASAQGLQVAVGGNIGTAMLDIIDPQVQCYVLELSSFQLERSSRFAASVAAILNISEDHIDRHGSLMNYHQAKQRIYRQAEVAVYNRDDDLTRPLSRSGLTELSFGQRAQSTNEYGFAEIGGRTFIVKGFEPVLAVDELALRGRHNALNVMAALAVGEAAGFSIEKMTAAARSFSGLQHRCKVLAEHSDILYVDDSKATNPGSTLAAINGLAGEYRGKLILLAGGMAKGADFDELATKLADIDFQLILFGKDARLIEAAVQKEGVGSGRILRANSMQQAVEQALAVAESGDLVLLSPACASFDMFDNYQHRGEVFAAALQGSGIPLGEGVLQ